MADQKTQPTDESVDAFLQAIVDASRRKDCQTVLAIMKRVTKKEPVMWGPAMVGFGRYHYKYASGHEGYSFMTGFSPRKQNLTIYIMPGFARYEAIMSRLGTFKTGKSCLYVKRLSDIDLHVLEELISESFEHMMRVYPAASD